MQLGCFGPCTLHTQLHITTHYVGGGQKHHLPSNTLPLLYSCASVPMDMICGMAQNLKMSRLCRPCMNLEGRRGGGNWQKGVQVSTAVASAAALTAYRASRSRQTSCITRCSCSNTRVCSVHTGPNMSWCIMRHGAQGEPVRAEAVQGSHIESRMYHTLHPAATTACWYPKYLVPSQTHLMQCGRCSKALYTCTGKANIETQQPWCARCELQALPST